MTKEEQGQRDLETRIAVLESFRGALQEWVNGAGDEAENDARKRANRNRIAAKRLIQDAGCTKMLTVESSPQPVNLLDVLFQDYHTVRDAIDVADMALGVYEHLLTDTGLVRLASAAQTTDIESAMLRALRKSFHDAPPGDERAVQDAVEVILAAIGVEYTREQDTAAVSARAYRPDFVIPLEELAIEIKYIRGKMTESKLEEELAADIAGYRTRWSRFMAIVYDHAIIRDPERMRREHLTHYGVTVLVIKH
jgi:hypothetical protein